MLKISSLNIRSIYKNKANIMLLNERLDLQQSDIIML